MTTPMSRRTFVGAVGFAAGAALLEMPLARAAGAESGRSEPTGPILLNSNENPYGPSPAALAALVTANSVANRYPDDAEDAMRGAIAKHHGVHPEHVVLGCGSSEILQMADLAFTGPGRKAVAAEATFEAVLRPRFSVRSR
jgi:histidinol-phosphate aminotransferase